jgi:hypothetical protein
MSNINGLRNAQGLCFVVLQQQFGKAFATVRLSAPREYGRGYIVFVGDSDGFENLFLFVFF